MNKLDKTELITKGSIYKALITLSIPIMINSLIQTLYNLVDGIFVSALSSVHFAATSFVWPVNFLFIALGIGVSIAGTSLLSQLVGGGKIERAKEYANQLIAVSFILSLVFTFLGFIISPFIIRAMGATGELAQLANIYLRITFLDMPFMFIYFNINSIMTSQGDTLTPTKLSGISALINIILDPIFIFLFNWGIAGAAWATLIARAALSLMGFILLFKDTNKIKPNFKGFKFNKEIIKEVVKVGLPSSIGQTGAALGFIILNKFVVSYGTATLAAFGMVNRVTSLIMQPAMGIGSALTTVVGQNIGANQIDRAEEGFAKATKVTLTAGIIGCIFILLLDNQIIDFFIQSKDDPEVITQGITFLRYISFSMPLMGMFSVLQGIFQGSGNTKYSMTMEIGRLWLVRIPMILGFKHLTNLGATGIWFSMSFSNLIVCLYGYWIYKMNGWKKRVMKTENSEQ